MKSKKVQALEPGLYLVKWKGEERVSVGAVGIDESGNRWLACTDSCCSDSDRWKQVEGVRQLFTA
jgi:hypothetical protein